MIRTDVAGCRPTGRVRTVNRNARTELHGYSAGDRKRSGHLRTRLQPLPVTVPLFSSTNCPTAIVASVLIVTMPMAFTATRPGPEQVTVTTPTSNQQSLSATTEAGLALI